MKSFTHIIFALALPFLAALAMAQDIPTILVNEVLSKEDSPLEDAVELYNPTNAPVNIGGWYLTDSHATPTKYRIPDGTIIPAKGYTVLLQRDFAAFLNFSGNGDSCFIYSADGVGNLTGYSHGFSFEGSDSNVSFGRYVNSIGEEHFVAQTDRTFGAANAGPKVGPIVFNEVMYHPLATDDEFIEFRNITNAAVKLYDPFIPQKHVEHGGRDVLVSDRH